MMRYLQSAHALRAVHVEPEPQVTQADAGWEGTPGGHLGNVALPLSSRVHIQEVSSTAFERERDIADQAEARR